MTLQIRNVARDISEIEVAGLIIKDTGDIPAEVGLRSSSIMSPLPNGYITDFSMTRDSYGGGSTAKMTVTYTLNYRLFYEPLGTNRVMALAHFTGLVEMIGLIWDAVLAIDVLDSNHDQVVDIVPLSIVGMGIVVDAADHEFWGCDLPFRVTEFVN